MERTVNEALSDAERGKEKAQEIQKTFQPFICNRGDCAITGFSTAEALESVSPHVYPKDVVVLTVAFLCGPLPVEAVESTLETLIDAIDFTDIKAIKPETATTVKHNIINFPTSGPRGSSISADYFREILSSAPPCLWHKEKITCDPSSYNVYDELYQQRRASETIFARWYYFMSSYSSCGRLLADAKSALDDM